MNPDTVGLIERALKKGEAVMLPVPAAGAVIQEILERLFPGSAIRSDGVFDPPGGWIFQVERHDGSKTVKLFSSPAIDHMALDEFLWRAAPIITAILEQPERRRVEIWAPPLRIEEVS